MTPEILAVAAIVLAAAVYLALLMVKKYRSRRSEHSCSGCGCGKAIQLTGRNTGQTY
jgi:uncharacterized membrane protein YdfJ with MMPL/SSD domain